MKCKHCGAMVTKPNYWNLDVCADGNRTRRFKLCDVCDFKLNAMMLEFFHVRSRKEKLKEYASR